MADTVCHVHNIDLIVYHTAAAMPASVRLTIISTENMKKALLMAALLPLCVFGQKAPADYVNPFIGTTNFGTCNPGAVCPAGLMSVVPFNVMGSDLNNFDKDARWWSTPYEETNSFFTGYSHVNLSGVGCPDMSSLLLMPTSGTLDVDYHNYGSTYSDEKATPASTATCSASTASRPK